MMSLLAGLSFGLVIGINGLMVSHKSFVQPILFNLGACVCVECVVYSFVVCVCECVYVCACVCSCVCLLCAPVDACSDLCVLIRPVSLSVCVCSAPRLSSYVTVLSAVLGVGMGVRAASLGKFMPAGMVSLIAVLMVAVYVKTLVSPPPKTKDT